jgi:hypothetical protein
MNEKNIENIMKQLVSLNVPIGIEQPLRMNISFQPDHFHLLYRQKKGKDIMNTNFHFEKMDNDYFCRYYDACLRKEVSIPAISVNNVDVSKLQERIKNLNWDIDLHNIPSEISESKTTWHREELIEHIVGELKQLCQTPEGLQIAERLKIKFWIDTPLAFLILNVNILKSQFEINQRFYFFEATEYITLDEAHRFLSYKWLEKQMNTNKKNLQNESMIDQSVEETQKKPAKKSK